MHKFVIIVPINLPNRLVNRFTEKIKFAGGRAAAAAARNLHRNESEGNSSRAMPQTLPKTEISLGNKQSHFLNQLS